MKKTEEQIWEFLSDFGKEIYYITDGILGQSAQGKKEATRYNATLGEASENGKPLYLTSMQEKLALFSATEIYPYSTPFGDLRLRKLWKQKMCRENPSLGEETCSLPVVTCGLTHGLSLVADLFVNPGDAVIHANQCWENYNTIYGLVHKGKIKEYALFDEEGEFNVAGLQKQIEEADSSKVILLLNFPNNPTGYTLSHACADRLAEMLKKEADAGTHMVVVVDDAYYGFFYTENCIKESLFTRLINLHPNLLPIRLDGATKELFASGVRVGFITYGIQDVKVQELLEQKTAAVIRAGISSCSHPAQSIVAAALEHPGFEKEQKEKRSIIQRRAEKILEIMKESWYRDVWEFYPFNSGYFVCLKLKKANAEKVRKYLLQRYQTGVIALNEKDIRISFLCLDEKNIEDFFKILYLGVVECQDE